MKEAWLMVLISAGTDALIIVTTTISASMLTMGTPEIPSKAVLLLALLGGITAFLRTISQALKNGLKLTLTDTVVPDALKQH